MQLDQDLLNLWLQARDGLPCHTARRLIEAVQKARAFCKDHIYCYKDIEIDGFEHIKDLELWTIDVDPRQQDIDALLEILKDKFPTGTVFRCGRLEIYEEFDDG